MRRRDKQKRLHIGSQYMSLLEKRWGVGDLECSSWNNPVLSDSDEGLCVLSVSSAEPCSKPVTHVSTRNPPVPCEASAITNLVLLMRNQGPREGSGLTHGSATRRQPPT